MCVAKAHVCDGPSRWESSPAAHDTTTLPRRWATDWSGSRSKRNGVRRVENEVSAHMTLTFAMGEGGEVRSD